MRIFIDTNIYLNFIDSSDEQSSSLVKLRRLIEDGRYSLVFPKITQDELFRNVDKVRLGYIATLSQIFPTKKTELATSISDTKLAGEVDNLRKEGSRITSELKKNYLASVKKWEDRINWLIKHSADIHESDEILKQAVNRRWKGNPPFGKGPMGDEIEWEIIIGFCLDDDITIITNDPDWKSFDKSKNELHPLLTKEWKSKTNKKIDFFDTLGKFLMSIDEGDVSEETVKKEKETAEKVNDYLWQGDTGVAGYVSTATTTTTTSPSASFSPSFSGTTSHSPIPVISHSTSSASGPSEYPGTTTTTTFYYPSPSPSPAAEPEDDD